MRIYQFLVLFVVLTTSIPVYFHYRHWQVFSTTQAALAFFLSLNTLICLWEISLGRYITEIHAEYQALSKKYGSRRWDAVIEFMLTPMTAKSLTFRFWTPVWSVYSLYDPSYANRESFGFFIDVGNGWSTLLPSLFYLYAMTAQESLCSARLVGIVGIVSFYQELYGTVIYFLSFIFNGRYKGKSFAEVVLFVGCSNGLWFGLPLLGIVASYHLIMTNTFGAFL